MQKVRSLLALALASSLIALGLVAVAPGSATGAPVANGDPDCSAFNDPVQQVVKPKNDVTLASVWTSEVAGAADYGFTSDLGTAFLASKTSAEGLVEVHRLYRSIRQDFLYSADPQEWTALTEGLLDYEDQGRSFYASPIAAPCLVPVFRYEKGGRHRLAASAADRGALVTDGWSYEGISFYAALAPGDVAPDPDPTPTPTPTGTPRPDTDATPTPTPTPTPTATATATQPPGGGGDTVFSFAAMPDTQQEVLSTKDTRFANRTNWLVQQRTALDLRWVAHSGDVHNWDTPAHDQYEVSSKAMKVLEDANIPYTLTIGNHDTMATGTGGGARDATKTRILQRDTTTFNTYYNASRYGVVSGAFEANKVDNIYATYNAGGLKWMVLVLELWPRQTVVDWAKTVVASHPDHNVIVATHDFISEGGIEQGAGYGELTPQQVFDQMVSVYPNVKMTISGHTGYASNRVLTGKNGNKIYSFLQTFHSNTTNPVRLFTIDTQADTIKTWIYAPYTDTTYGAYSQTITGVNWVR